MMKENMKLILLKELKIAFSTLSWDTKEIFLCSPTNLACTWLNHGSKNSLDRTVGEETSWDSSKNEDFHASYCQGCLKGNAVRKRIRMKPKPVNHLPLELLVAYCKGP